VSEEAARGPATSAFLTERALRSIIARGRERTGETLVVWSGACQEPFPQESHFTPKNPPIGRSLPPHRRFTAYLSFSTDRLSSDHRLDRTDHLLPSRSAQSS
jgi:hypothetical protein